MILRTVNIQVSSSTSNQASTSKTIVTGEESGISFEGDTIELIGIPLNRLLANNLQIFQCNICMDISTEAITCILSNCHQVFSEHCIQRWLACNGVSPSCHQFVDADDIAATADVNNFLFTFNTLHVFRKRQ